MTTPRAYCVRCGRRERLRVDGTFMTHSLYDNWNPVGFRHICPGTGLEPVSNAECICTTGSYSNPDCPYHVRYA